MRILLVEDDSSLSHIYSRALTAAGYAVVAAGDGAAALEHLHEPYEVVVTDIRMPNMDGLALTRELRARAPDVPIIAITAHLDMEAYTEARDMGIFRYLRKPFPIAIFVRTVHDAVQLRESRRRLCARKSM